MSEYSVEKILKLIENLSIAEKQILKSRLPQVLDYNQQEHSSLESRGGTVIYGSEAVELNPSISQKYIRVPEVQEALQLLAKIKQKLDQVATLNKLEKRNAISTIEIIGDELKKLEPDQDLIKQAIEVLMKTLREREELLAITIQITDLLAASY